MQQCNKLLNLRVNLTRKALTSFPGDVVPILPLTWDSAAEFRIAGLSLLVHITCMSYIEVGTSVGNIYQMKFMHHLSLPVNNINTVNTQTTALSE